MHVHVLKRRVRRLIGEDTALSLSCRALFHLVDDHTSLLEVCQTESPGAFLPLEALFGSLKAAMEALHAKFLLCPVIFLVRSL